MKGHLSFRVCGMNHNSETVCWNVCTTLLRYEMNSEETEHILSVLFLSSTSLGNASIVKPVDYSFRSIQLLTTIKNWVFWWLRVVVGPVDQVCGSKRLSVRRHLNKLCACLEKMELTFRSKLVMQLVGVWWSSMIQASSYFEQINLDLCAQSEIHA